MNSNQVTVIYKWTANPEKLDELVAIYRSVLEGMHTDEPGALAVHCHVSKEENALYVRDDFKDADALGFHLSHTAPKHFPALLQIAVPGAFTFLGDVPAELQQATKQMGLAAEFAPHAFGFER